MLSVNWHGVVVKCIAKRSHIGNRIVTSRMKTTSTSYIKVYAAKLIWIIIACQLQDLHIRRMKLICHSMIDGLLPLLCCICCFEIYIIYASCWKILLIALTNSVLELVNFCFCYLLQNYWQLFIYHLFKKNVCSHLGTVYPFRTCIFLKKYRWWNI